MDPTKFKGIGETNKLSMMEAGLRSGNCAAVLTGEDSKKFRVRVLAGEAEIYQKYFRKDIAKKISKVQIIIAAVVIMFQIGTMCLLRHTTSLESAGMGIWTSFFTFLGAAFVLWTCKKITYLRLHLSMVSQILSAVGCIMLLMCALGDSIPTLRYRLYERYSSQDNYYNNNYYYNSDGQVNDGVYNSSMGYHAYPYNYNHYYHRRHYSDYGPASFLVVSFILTTVISVLTIVQLLLSIVMSIMTLRSMCSGRSNLEGKMFAMEIAGAEDSFGTATILRKNSHVEQGIGLHSPSRNPSGTLPPPYDKILLGHSDAASVA